MDEPTPEDDEETSLAAAAIAAADEAAQHPLTDNAQFQAQVQQLHRLTVKGRWLVVVGLWLTVGLCSLWGLGSMFNSMQQYFTWAAVRYGLAFHPIAALGLAICIGMTVAVLLWQSRNILWGWPEAYRRTLEQRVSKIRQQGPTHPLWRWMNRT